MLLLGKEDIFNATLGSNVIHSQIYKLIPVPSSCDRSNVDLMIECLTDILGKSASVVDVQSRKNNSS